MKRNKDCGKATTNGTEKRNLHRQVRVVYRACRRLYGKEKTQDECLKVFKIIFPEMYRLRNSAEDYADVPENVKTMLRQVTSGWNPTGRLKEVIDRAFEVWGLPFSWEREALIGFYDDIMPVVMRIRKLTPTETGRLMGLKDEEIEVMYNAGLSNSSLYKLHGNSIVVDVMTAMFDKLLVNTGPEMKEGTQLSLF